MSIISMVLIGKYCMLASDPPYGQLSSLLTIGRHRMSAWCCRAIVKTPLIWPANDGIIISGQIIANHAHLARYNPRWPDCCDKSGQDISS